MEEQEPREIVPAVSVRYVGIGQLTVFFVSEDELRLIESGSPAATCLNLGIAFSCLGIGCLTSLLLSEPSKSLHQFIVVVVITVLSLIAGVVLLAIWMRFRKQASDVIARIRSRAIPSAGATVKEAPTDLA
jgi:uncharacterized membrane protein